MELVIFFQDFTDCRVILFFSDSNLRANCCQSRLTAGPEPDSVFNLNLCDRIIDIGLPAKDHKQYLLVMTPPKTVLLPHIIMDLPIFVIAEWATLLVDIRCPRGGS